MPTDSHVAQDVYDVQLLRIDVHTGTLYFTGGHLLTLARHDELRWWHVGEIGVLRLGVMPHGWGWRPYPDQRLRRAPERDDQASGRWAWRLIRTDAECADGYLLTKVDVIPGTNGAFVRQDVETVELDLPREFRELCRAYRQQPGTVLRAFVADVCSLRNFVKCHARTAIAPSAATSADLRKTISIVPMACTLRMRSRDVSAVSG